MVNILIIDDEQTKRQEIYRVLSPYISDEVFVAAAGNINEAKRKLREKNYDVMILDIHLPQTECSATLTDGGIKLLKEIKESRTMSFFYPRYVISVSGYKDSTETFANSEGAIHTAINYDPSNTDWEQELKIRIEAAIAIVSNTTIRRAYDYDIAVICALKEEIDVIAEGLQGVKEINVEYDDDIYHTGYFEKDGQKIRVVFSNASQMGMVAATSLATKMINNFIPKYIVMTGITGGTKPEKMNYGDIIVAAKAWDYRAGKDVKKDEEHLHMNSIDQKSIDATLLGYCRRLQNDTNSLRTIKDSFKQGNKPDTELKLLIGPIASGASVVTDPQIVEDIINNQDRDVLGIEMEIYGMYYASYCGLSPKPKFIALKSVSDFANQGKNDDYHAYASYTSAKAFEILAKEYFIYD